MSLFPKTLAKIVEPLTRPLFKSRGLAGTQLLTDWRRIVGDSLADHCAPEKISFPPGVKTGGTLTIAVENGFALEMQHMQPVILERLNIYFGYQAVTRIAISHGFQPAAAKPTAAPPAVVLDESSVLAADAVNDPELKAALQSLANSFSGKYN